MIRISELFFGYGGREQIQGEGTGSVRDFLTKGHEVLGRGGVIRHGQEKG